MFCFIIVYHKAIEDRSHIQNFNILVSYINLPTGLLTIRLTIEVIKKHYAIFQHYARDVCC